MAITEFAMRHKRLCSVLLIICVVFFNIYALQQEAHAFTLVTITLGILATVALSLAVAYGISFATADAAQTFAEDYATEPTLDGDMDGFNDTLFNAVSAGEVIYNAIAEDTEDGYFYDVPIDDDAWADFVDYVHANFSAGANTYTVDTNVNYPINEGNTLFDISQEVIGTIKVVYVDGAKYALFEPQNVSDTCTIHYAYYRTSDDYMYNQSYYSDIVSAYYDETTLQLKLVKSNMSEIVYSYSSAGLVSIDLLGTETTVDTGVWIPPDIFNDLNYDWANSGSGDREIAVDVYPAPADTTGDITLADGTGLVVDEEQAYTDAITANPADVIDRDLVGVPEAVSVPAESAETAVEDATTVTEVSATDETQTSLKGLFISKFPFCIPWDLANAFELIAAPAEAPNFEIDFLSGMDTKIGFQGDTSINFDMANYPIIGQISRWMFTIEFCIALMLATRKVMKW